MSSSKSSLVRLQLDFCKNKTDPKKGILKTDCYTREETQKFLSSKRIQMNYIIQTANIDSTNFLNPGSSYIYSNSINTNAFSWTRLNILFKKIVVETDTGFFVEDKKIWEDMVLEAVTSESLYTPETDTVFSFLIGNLPWKEIYYRRYIKIQDIFAMMGGFVKASLMILGFIVEFVTKPKIVDLFNKNYKYQANEVKDAHINQKIQSLKNLNYSDIMQNNFLGPSIYIDTNTSKIKMSNSENINKIENMKNDLLSDNDTTSLVKCLKMNKNKIYTSNLSNFKKVLRCFISAKKDTQIKFYKLVEAKLKRIISFEHIIKITKNVRFFREFILKEHQGEIIKICQAPSKKMYSPPINLEQLSEKMLNGINQEKLINACNVNGIDTKLYEILVA